VWKWAKYKELILFFTPKYTPCLTSQCVGIQRFTHSTNSGENRCFFQRSSFWAIGGPGHLAMIMTRGGASSESNEQGHLVSSFEPGSVIRLSPWSWVFFCTVWFSLCSTMRVHKKIGQCSYIS
jgi:hypothetical protein